MKALEFADFFVQNLISRSRPKKLGSQCISLVQSLISLIQSDHQDRCMPLSTGQARQVPTVSWMSAEHWPLWRNSLKIMSTFNSSNLSLATTCKDEWCSSNHFERFILWNHFERFNLCADAASLISCRADVIIFYYKHLKPFLYITGLKTSPSKVELTNKLKHLRFWNVR